MHSPRKSEPLIMVEMVFPNTTNHYGTMFGGKVLDLMDRAAFLSATRFSERAIVTASMERIDFFKPIKQGNLIELRAKVIYTGRTSITVKVDLYAEDPKRGMREHSSQGYFHMVAVDEAGKPVEVPQLKVEGKDEQEDWDEAHRLREVVKTLKRKKTPYL